MVWLLTQIDLNILVLTALVVVFAVFIDLFYLVIYLFFYILLHHCCTFYLF